MLLANFNRKEHLRHRAVSLRQHGFLVIFPACGEQQHLLEWCIVLAVQIGSLLSCTSYSLLCFLVRCWIIHPFCEMTTYSQYGHATTLDHCWRSVLSATAKCYCSKPYITKVIIVVVRNRRFSRSLAGLGWQQRLDNEQVERLGPSFDPKLRRYGKSYHKLKLP